MKCIPGLIEYLLYFANLLCLIEGVLSIVIGANTIDDTRKTIDFNTSVILICLGIFFIGTSFFGSYGIKEKNVCVLILFTFIMFFVFGVQIYLGHLSSNMKETKKEFRDSYADFFKNFTLDPNVARKVNSYQRKYKCCGVEGPSDFKTKDILTEPSDHYPFSCCDSLKLNQRCYIPYSIGCIDKMYDNWIFNLELASYTMFGFCILWFVSACLSIFLVFWYRRERRQEIDISHT